MSQSRLSHCLASRAFSITAAVLCLVVLTTGCNTALTPGTPGGRSSGAAPGPAADGLPLPEGLTAPDLAPAADGEAAAVREIEEADVVKVVGDKIYLLNRHKGLIIVDVADPDHPRMVGSTVLRGRPIEMFVVGTRALVVLNSDFGYIAFEGNDMVGRPVERSIAPPDFEGSRVAIVDIGDATQPAVLSKINLAGFASQSRRVGDILYIAGQNLPSSFGTPSDGDGSGAPDSFYDQERGFVASISVADPTDIQPVDRKAFRGGSVAMHVSTEAIFAASRFFDSDRGEALTRVQYVDITDPAGTIAIRGSVDVPGHISNRFFMDDFEGTFRIATESGGFGFREVRLFTYDIADPNIITPLGSVDIIRDESLRAVRFDGPRAYAVTFLQVDPLFVIDLSDPTAPAVTGELEVPGFSTHIEPRGDRLIAIGIDDTDGRRPAVAYYDVSNTRSPTSLGRVVLGPPMSFTESDAVYDEKAFKIIDALGLIVIPFSHVDYSMPVDMPPPDGPPVPPMPVGGGAGAPGIVAGEPFVRSRVRCVNAVQLVDFSDTELIQRGWFDTRARVQRVGVVGDRVFAISQASVETVDISDRDAPVLAGEAPFFGPDEAPFFDTGCGPVFIDGPPDFVPIDQILQMTVGELLARVLRDGGMCGTVAALPMMSLVVGLTFMSCGARRRRRPTSRRRNVRSRR